MNKNIVATGVIIALIAIGGLATTKISNIREGKVSVLENKTESGTETNNNTEVFAGITPTRKSGGKEDESNKSWFQFDVDPGEKVTGTILLQNTSSEYDQIADMYSVGTNASQSSFVPNSKEDPGPEAKWISLDAKVPVEKGGSVEVPFTITIPKNATPGSHALAIMTQTIRETPKAGEKKEGNTNKVSIATSIGLRVYINVKGDIKTSAKIGDVTMVSKDPYGFKIQVANTGNSIIKAVIELEAISSMSKKKVEGASGKTKSEYELFPGGKSDMYLEWKYDEAGIYLLKFKVSYNGKTEEKSMKIVIYPTWKQVAIGVGGLLILLLTIWNIISMIRRKNAQQSPIVTPQSNGNNVPPPPPSPPTATPVS